MTEVFILSSEDATVTDASFKRAVRSLQASASDRGAEAVTFYDTDDPVLVSDDRHTTLMPVSFPKPDETADRGEVVRVRSLTRFPQPSPVLSTSSQQRT